MSATEPYRIKTISEFHHLVGLPRPEHPLISVINLEGAKFLPEKRPASRMLDFYTISLKRHCNGNF
jgi:AraC family transcriptional activator of pobA